MPQYHSDDRPDPAEQPIRARVPDHVATGAFSTGVIVMTAHSEFILDFVQNLGRPHQIVARVVMPHHVLPQLVDALQRNIELYRNRWGPLPHTGGAAPAAQELNTPAARPAASNPPAGSESRSPGEPSPLAGPVPPAAATSAGSDATKESATPNPPSPPHPSHAEAVGGSASSQPSDAGTRQASVQDIYDDLKIRDEFLSGAYANAVMIGHGPHEFSFDFITNFYPHSAVSSRVFLAAGQIPRLFESLKSTWEQIRTRMQPPGRQHPPAEGSPEDPRGNRPDQDEPFA